METETSEISQSSLSTVLLTIVFGFFALAFFLVFVPLPRFSFGVSTPIGLTSSTKAIMQNLRSAILKYQKDIGRFPHIGEKYSEFNLNSSQDIVLGLTRETNVLADSLVGDHQKSFPWHGLDRDLYQKKWKGPYLDSLPDKFMKDSFDNQIKYVFFDNKLWLWSAGRDKIFSPLEKVAIGNYSGDDIIVSISPKPIIF
jgi:hypothetical protein